MKSANKVGVITVVVTALFMTALLVGYSTLKDFVVRSFFDNSSETEKQIEETNKDSDNDGLPDLFEKIYETDINNPDTDKDGINDLDEIEQGKDPVISESSDTGNSLVGKNTSKEATYTEKYLALLPANMKREDILSMKRVETFVTNNMGELLPKLLPGEIKTTKDTGKEAIKAYLDQISSSSIHVITNDEIEQALTSKLQLKKDVIDDIIKKLDQNITILKGIKTPEEIVSLHTKLVQATAALYENVVLLSSIDNDFVGGLIASKKIDDLGGIFQEISNEIKSLEKKYEL